MFKNNLYKSSFRLVNGNSNQTLILRKIKHKAYNFNAIKLLGKVLITIGS